MIKIKPYGVYLKFGEVENLSIRSIVFYNNFYELITWSRMMKIFV